MGMSIKIIARQLCLSFLMAAVCVLFSGNAYAVSCTVMSNPSPLPSGWCWKLYEHNDPIFPILTGNGYLFIDNEYLTIPFTLKIYSNNTTLVDTKTTSGQGSSYLMTVKVSDYVIPAAPRNVVVDYEYHGVWARIDWDPVSYVTSYTVWRNTINNSGSATKIASTAGGYYDDENSGIVYYYWVKAENEAGSSGFSPTCTQYVPYPPNPYSVTATDGIYTGKISLIWGSISIATGYEVWRNVVNNSASATRIASNVPSTNQTHSTYDDTTADGGAVYYYWVKAVNPYGASSFSLSDSGYAILSAPSAPSGVSASDGVHSNKVRVTWGVVSGATSYEVWRNTANNSGSATRVTNNLAGTIYDDVTAVAGTVYYYWVKAVNSSGTSGFSGSDEGYARASEWTKTWGSTNTDYTVEGGIDVDSQGYVYVNGYVQGSVRGQPYLGSFDANVTKLDSLGNLLWTKSWGSTNTEYPWRVLCNPQGDVVTLGSTDGSFDGQTNAGSFDFFMTTMNSAGSSRWSRIWGGTGSDEIISGTYDERGSLYVIGDTFGSFGGFTNAGDRDVYVAKLDSSCNVIWTSMFGSKSNDLGRGIAVAQNGDIFVSGTTSGAFGGQTNAGMMDVYLAKLNSTGAVQWVRMYGSTNDEAAGSILMDTAENIYVGAGITGPYMGQVFRGGGRDISLTKFNSSGSLQWVRIWGSADYDQFHDFAIDASDNVYVAGRTRGEFSGGHNVGLTDVCLTKMDSNGNEIWTHMWGSTNQDYGKSVKTDANGIVYVTGHTAGDLEGCTNNGIWDIFLTKWSFTNFVGDTDQDGVIDRLEVNSYGSNPRLSDSDGDGLRDADEIIAGTSLTNKTDCFRVVNTASITNTSNLIISWDGKVGRVYGVQENTNLTSGTWADISGHTNLLGTGSIMTYTGSVSGVGDFYRVKVRQGP